MKIIKFSTIGIAWVCWVSALIIWNKFSWLLFISGFIPYLIQNQFVNHSIGNKDDEENKNQA